jgi:Tat protein secretion system quality control protein TatD with DNase activity
MNYAEINHITGTDRRIPGLRLPVTACPPNCIAALLHWRVVGNMLGKLLPSLQEEFTHLDNRLTYGGQVMQVRLTVDEVTFTDSHFHLDICLKESGCRHFGEYERKFRIPHHNLRYAIANFVYPENWHKAQAVTDPRIFVTFGIHPHLAHKRYYSVYDLKRQLDHPSCVGIGEIGMDLTKPCNCFPRCRSEFCRIEILQLEFLEEVLEMKKTLTRDFPIVLHCRDARRGPRVLEGRAAAAVLQMLVRHGMSNARIHRHCFIGSAAELRTWTQIPTPSGKPRSLP